MKRISKCQSIQLLVALVLLILVGLSGCAHDRESVREDRRDIADMAEADTTSSPLDDTAASEDSQVVTGPADAPKPVGRTLGERLKRLDSLIDVSSGDSLDYYVSEYERIVDSALNRPESVAEAPVQAQPLLGVRTDSPTALAAPQNTNESDVLGIASSDDAQDRSEETPTQAAEPRVRNVESSRKPHRNVEIALPVSERAPETETVEPERDNQDEQQSGTEPKRSQRSYRTLTQSTFDPTDYEGVRESELKHYRESSREPAEARTSRTTKRAPKKVQRRTRKHATSATVSSSASGSAKGRNVTTAYVEGMALYRAGSYSAASAKLKIVTVSGSASQRSKARYFRAVSLERSGQLSAALSQYRSIRSSGGSYSNNAWIGMARVLKALGRRSEAKSVLLKFVSARPGSSLISSAKRLLQTI